MFDSLVHLTGYRMQNPEQMEGMRIGSHVSMHLDLSFVAENAYVHFLGMQVDTTVVFGPRSAVADQANRRNAEKT